MIQRLLLLQRKCLKCQLFLMKTEGRESISAAVYVKNLRRAAMSIRSAQTKDLSRIAEIFVFNNRINYLPIFKDESYSFGELQVVSFIEQYLKKKEVYQNLYVYDDGLIKGFLQMKGTEIYKLYIEPCFQREGIGHELIEFAIKEFGADHLWVLEKNVKAIAFYNRHGFCITGQKQFEEGTTEYVMELKREIF